MGGGSLEITVVSILLALVQVAIYLLLGRAAMYVFAGVRRDDNFIYQIFKKGTEPLVKATRYVTPRFIVDRHVPFVTFLLLIMGGLVLVNIKQYLCLIQGLQC